MKVLDIIFDYFYKVVKGLVIFAWVHQNFVSKLHVKYNYCKVRSNLATTLNVDCWSHIYLPLHYTIRKTYLKLP